MKCGERVERGYIRREEIERMMKRDMGEKREEVVRDLFVLWRFRGLGYWDVKKVREEKVERLFEGNVWIMRGRKKSKREWNMGLLDVGGKIIEK